MISLCRIGLIVLIQAMVMSGITVKKMIPAIGGNPTTTA
jgi:hypothetical protein